ncbi:bifunctional AP-4-A phosphorylase/ADP sulfurylase [Lithohypha guttulata]|uniref:Bifunctional AP-4-A phosphorylase/ADP sulfurylase n=1 Tax=Lithohypha guttulata TaxID=1690604 RepID=A0AAN7SXN5_9EURO|nr:bifunctional AP-4-A phosphorylase/ADP sulfurylase [Lithohypha guttulata]
MVQSTRQPILLGLTEPLRTIVNRKFVRARANQDLLFSETQLSVIHSKELDITIQLRYCPALKSKPKQTQHEQTAKKFDPFEDPAPGLLIERIPPQDHSHNLVLNKYPVIENHFIAATKHNKPQSDLLEEDDLYATYACLRSWQEDIEDDSRRALFAFFNSGEHSGASQPHRHLQFLPVENMISDDEAGWGLLCDSMTFPAHDGLPLLHNPNLPFIHFATKLGIGMDGRALSEKYMLLMKAAFATINAGCDLSNIDKISMSPDKGTAFSYNLAMTTEIMAILPRKAEAGVITGTSDGIVFVNGTVLAGTMMVKSEDDFARLREEPELVQQVLRHITYPVRTTRM